MKIELQPIANVTNSRKAMGDDHWGEVLSEIELEKSILPEALEEPPY